MSQNFIRHAAAALLVLAAAFGERGGLTLPGAAFGFEKLQQPLLLGFELVDASLACPTSVTEPFFHAASIAKAGSRSCASSPQSWGDEDQRR